MKRKAITIVTMLFLASTVMALFPLSVKAKARVTYFIGTETSGPILDFGTWTFPGGNILVRGFVHVWYDDCDDPRVSGTNTVVANVNSDATTGVGTMWGTFSSVSVVEGGWWEGTWTGKFHADGSSSVRAVGHGRGLFEGLKAKMTVEFSPDPAEPGIISGYILDPHGE